MATGPLPDVGALLEHEGRRYRIESIQPHAALAGGPPIDAPDAQWHKSWVIRDADGRTAGSLIVLAQEGESGDPVYGGILPGETETRLEGSDWAGITLALINQAEGRGIHTLEPRG